MKIATCGDKIVKKKATVAVACELRFYDSSYFIRVEM